MNLVGNQWRKVLTPTVTQDDTVLTVSTINVEDNPSYTSPPGVFRERDRSKPDQEVFKNEQSLQLSLQFLEDGDSREVVKDLYRPLDVFNYKEMKMFIHGDLDELPGSVSHYVDETDYSSEVYFRFGADSLNYYEYRQPVRAGWNEISLIFDQLTAIKQARDSIDVIYRIDVPGEVGHSYAVLGNPTLTRVNFFSVGILNPRNKGTLNESVSGNIWINELRVLDADDSPGWAYSASSSFTFADLMTVNVNMSQTNPYFHKLADRFGSRVDKKNWGFSVNFDVLKLVPVNLTGSNLKVNFSRTESIAKPLYLPGTDIFVDSAASQTKQKLVSQGVDEGEADQIAEQIKADAQTINVSDTWTVSNIKLKIPSNEWYIRDTFNSLTFNFNYNKTFSRNPTTLKNSSWQWKAGANYQVSLSKDYFFYPADIPLLGYVIELFEDYRNAKVYFTPQTVSSSLTANRKRNFQQSRTTTTPANIQRDFTTQRNMQFNWRITEGGLLNLTTSYNVDVQSSLTYLLADELTQIEREESDIWRDIINGALFGRDFNYRQTFDLKTSPKLPSLWDLNRFFSLNASYNVSYNWKNNFQQEELGRSAGFQNRISAGFTLRLKSLMAPLFEEEIQQGGQQQSTSPSGRGRGRGGERNIDDEINRRNQPPNRTQTPENNEAATDTTQTPADEIQEVERDPIYVRAWHAIKSTAKWIFFDYDQISLDFNQTNSQNSTGLLAEGTGFSNFWGFRQATKDGPTRAFMFGLSYDAGPRANNGNLSDNFSQKNTIDFKTSRPLWENAQIDLTWKVGWGINKSTSLRTDSLGNVTITNLTSTGNIDRSFLSFPPSLVFSIFGSGIKTVNELYDPNDPNPATNLSNAFVEGFESLPLFSSLPILKDLAKYVPRPNWRFSWSGLEKISFFEGFAQRVSLNHAYSSSYSEGWKINPDGLQEIQTQKVNYGFQPLLGINLTFDKLWGGDLTGSIKYSTKTNYDLGLTTRNITESFQRDINITASYSKSGFEVPLFGISLKNDIEISFSYTSGKTSTVIFEMDNFKEEGKPQDGTTRTTIEPRIKYVMSSRVTLSLFYKRTSVEPEGAARIPPTTTNEAGLDVHISIQ
jgi:cell surface protein SprA